MSVRVSSTCTLQTGSLLATDVRWIIGKSGEWSGLRSLLSPGDAVDSGLYFTATAYYKLHNHASYLLFVEVSFARN